MKRRNFVYGLGAGLALPLIASDFIGAMPSVVDGLIPPKALKAGDTVGLITPATFVPDPDRLATAERTIKYFGLRMRMGKYAGKRMGDYRISIQERLDDLHAMFRDKDVDAIFAIRKSFSVIAISPQCIWRLTSRQSS
jgi:muramoyltetrapeptide carboxypeptidase